MDIMEEYTWDIIRIDRLIEFLPSEYWEWDDCGKIDMKFNIELLMFPSWATKKKIYQINNEYYTHIRIKRNLIRWISTFMEVLNIGDS